MASFVKRGQFNKRSGTGTQVVDGLGFQPKALLLYSNGQASNVISTAEAPLAHGLTVGPSDSYSVAITHRTSISIARNSMLAAALHFVSTGGTITVSADLSSFDADGFTLNWTINNSTGGAPDDTSVIDYIAFGGDIDANIVTWALPSGTGSHAVTGMGFEPELLFHLYGNNNTTAFPSGGTFGSVGVGAVDASGNQLAAFTTTNGGSNNARSLHTDAMVFQVAPSGADRVSIAHTSMDAEGFTGNITTTDALYEGNQYITLGIRGINARAGSYQRSTSTQNVISGIGFAPDTLFGMSALTTSINTTATTFSGYARGFGDGSGQAVRVLQYTNNAPRRYQASDAIHANIVSSAAANVTELVSLDAGGFTVGWVSGSDAHHIGYVALAGIPDPTAAEIEATTLLQPVATLTIQHPAHITASTLLTPVAELTIESEPTGANIAAETLFQPIASLSIQQDHLIVAETLLRLVTALSLQTDDIARISATTLLQPIATMQLGTAHHVRASVLLRPIATLAIQQDHLIRASTLLRVLAHDNYVGPGTGIHSPGAAFTVNALREGDTFSVFLPWAGLEGISGLAHVMSRTARDDRAEQDVELAIVEVDDSRNVPKMRGGARPKPGPDSTDTARTQARQSREIDRIERERT